MKHLLDEQLYDLTVKIATNGAFSREDVANMQHIAQCEECYQMLCCIRAMQDVSMHLGDFATLPAAAGQKTSVQSVITTVIRLAITKVQPILEQLEAGIAAWSFDAPLALPGARSTKAAGKVKKLEDVDNSQTFVAYDPDQRILVIQLACPADSKIPSVQLKLPDGSLRDVELVQKGAYLMGEVDDLEEGDYQIILSK